MVRAESPRLQGWACGRAAGACARSAWSQVLISCVHRSMICQESGGDTKLTHAQAPAHGTSHYEEMAVRRRALQQQRETFPNWCTFATVEYGWKRRQSAGNRGILHLWATTHAIRLIQQPDTGRKGVQNGALLARCVFMTEFLAARDYLRRSHPRGTIGARRRDRRTQLQVSRCGIDRERGLT